MDLRDLDRRALAAAGAAVNRVKRADLARPTPCGDWTLGQLLGHMIGHNRGFAAAAAGRPTVPAVWDDLTPPADPRKAYADSVTLVTKAFSDRTLLDRKIEVYGYGTFTAPTVLGMHFVDFLVHGWDVAKAIGADAALDPELSAAAMKIALRWPTDRPSKAFGVMVEPPADSSTGDRLVAYLGRSPGWSPGH
ncbi:TIGR03086 family metal-binding protein [Catellatospora bangladeshensis]|uniref:TIGR03086 family protein n=1 Tax=Catellatospora bangladeshensis TaxID=310355 RepID=A0A8J3NLM0_9ACTN|nr:TIGR03086 family metal-binding protein [Catellatospora bangladeshensis]GIF84101.1 TIGR03086 family protein [Catellatospora bangladeshensis]